jgi:muramidase (phage lysozyme)
VLDRLIATIATVSFGSDTWTTGDRHLASVRVTLGQDARSSSCEFALDDPGWEIAAKYIEISQKQGGIVGLPPEQQAAISGSGLGGATANGTLSPNMRAFLDMLAYAEGTSGPDGYRTMFTGKTFSDLSQHPRQMNCSGSLCSDAAGRYQFLSDTWAEMGQPNFSPESQDLGAVKLIGIEGATGDIEAGNISSAIAKTSNRWASLPGSPYGQPIKTEAELLQVYNQALAKYQGQAAPQTVASTAKQPIQVEPKLEEVKEKGAQITISLGFDGTLVSEFKFTHTATETDLKTQQTTFSGQSVRWHLNRELKNTAYTNITLKGLALQVAQAQGFKLDFQAPDVKYKFLDQTSLTDYQLLYREVSHQGLQVTETKDNKTLVVRTPQAVDSGFVIRWGQDLSEGRITDRAIADLQPVDGGTTASKPVQSTGKSEAKFSINATSGTLEQLRPEKSTIDYDNLSFSGATTQLKLPKYVTGSAKKANTGLFESSTADVTANREGMVRVKGLPSEFTLATSPEVLKLEPGQSFKSEGFPGQLSRAWVIDSISHELQGGVMRTRINGYSPMSVKATLVSAGTGGSATGSSGTLPPPGSGDIPSRIAAAAAAYRGTSSAAMPGTDGGKLACAATVNTVMQNAGLKPLGSNTLYVPSVESDLQSGRGTQVAQSQSRAGDIVIESNQEHIGICQNDGCTSVISNSSSRASFSWQSSTNFDGYYGGGSSRIYRVTS